MFQYESILSKDTLMGPNSMKLLDEMAACRPEAFDGAQVLDLGCGQGLSSLYLAKQTRARRIFATDLWISAEQLWRNCRAWQIDDCVIPIHADARELPYAPEFFDAVVSVDAYHYFGREKHFFADKIWPLVRPGGVVMIAMPGIRETVTDYPELMVEWAQEEVGYFRDLEWWEQTLCDDLSDLESLTAFESARTEEAWEDWFASGHEYARQDKAYFDRGLGQYLNFVCLILKKRA